MSSSFIWNNLLTYSLQIGLLVGLAAFVPAMVRLRLPGAKLLYLQILLAACLLLPVVQPWRQEVSGNNLEVTTSVIVVERGAAGTGSSVPWRQLGLGLLAAGLLIRLGWLAVGFRRLGRYRRNARRLDSDGSYPTFLSDDVSSPVTFGFRKPVVLLPAGFPEMDPARQQAILCHEFLHIERGDWLMMVAEEVVRATFWFHPAIWWVLGEIQLAREQAVDREVVRRTQSREEYVDALLEIAGAHLHPDLAPAPLFLRKRHLRQRVASIFKEVQMSKTRLISKLALGLAILVLSCWLVTGTFPLAAAPQANDGPGVTVDVGASTVMHRTPVIYPEAARRKGVQGSVVLEATLDGSGNVSDARVLSGPDELRKGALTSLLQWHFANGAAGTTRQVTIGFQLADGKTAAVKSADNAFPLPGGRVFPNTAMLTARLTGRIVRSISVLGLSDQARRELLSTLPVHEGDTLSAEQIARVEQAVRGFDEHLRLMGGPISPTEATLQIMSPDVPPVLPSAEAQPGVPPSRIKIGGNVQQMKLISQPHPVYPPDAKAARIQGVVQLSAIIGKDGAIQKLEVISGHPLLVPSALEAVQQWKYQTTLLNGEPVEVITQIDVNYTLMP